MTKYEIGRYNGVCYKRQRICDVMASDSRAQWYFTYLDDMPTGDHFKTLGELRDAVDQMKVEP